MRGEGEDEVRVVATARMRTGCDGEDEGEGEGEDGSEGSGKGCCSCIDSNFASREKVGPDTQSTVLRGEGKTFSRAVEEILWADVGWTCGGEDNSNLTCG